MCIFIDIKVNYHENEAENMGSYIGVYKMDRRIYDEDRSSYCMY
ncbi:hypothetical protein CSC2_35340 [Clostridium zeae]|uniref:Uncharacterized protein n=1 Tax=Clostridium zeae TaxID=2759022 RepID=A0ABQ1EDV9_9CLOT|nr:hypothetical protein CSC2_35340 [Clostridium zeae]